MKESCSCTQECWGRQRRFLQRKERQYLPGAKMIQSRIIPPSFSNLSNSPLQPQAADHSGRMTNHGHIYARGNGAKEKGSPNMHNKFLKYMKLSWHQSWFIFFHSVPLKVKLLTPGLTVVKRNRREVILRKPWPIDHSSPSSPPHHSNLRCHIL